MLLVFYFIVHILYFIFYFILDISRCSHCVGSLLECVATEIEIPLVIHHVPSSCLISLSCKISGTLDIPKITSWSNSDMFFSTNVLGRRLWCPTFYGHQMFPNSPGKLEQKEFHLLV
jgi:hypothetical protein